MSIGEVLKEKRIALDYTIDEISQIIKIKSYILDKLENNENIEGFSLTYQLGHLKAYAQFLGLDVDDIIKQYLSYIDTVKQKDDFPTPQVYFLHFVPKGAILTCMFVSIILYNIFFYHKAIEDKFLHKSSVDQDSMRNDNYECEGVIFVSNKNDYVIISEIDNMISIFDENNNFLESVALKKNETYFLPSKAGSIKAKNADRLEILTLDGKKISVNIVYI